MRKSISDVTHNDVADFIADLKRYRRPDGTALKGWTIRGAVSVLSGVFVEAADEGVLASNPVEKVSKRKREKVDDETTKRILSIDEIDVLLAAARERGLRWQALVGLFVFSGLRLGEALGLTWGDIDLEAGEIRVRKQRDAKTGVSGTYGAWIPASAGSRASTWMRRVDRSLRRTQSDRCTRTG